MPENCRHDNKSLLENTPNAHDTWQRLICKEIFTIQLWQRVLRGGRFHEVHRRTRATGFEHNGAARQILAVDDLSERGLVQAANVADEEQFTHSGETNFNTGMEWESVRV